MTIPRIGSFAALLLAGLAWAGCAFDPRNCCDQYGALDEPGIYCNAHKDAILEFVRDPRDPGERRDRLEWFKKVLQTLEPMDNSDDIHSRLAVFEKSRPDFWTPYDKHHFWAGRDTNLGLERRGELMKCGFRHAVHMLEAETP